VQLKKRGNAPEEADDAVPVVQHPTAGAGVVERRVGIPPKVEAVGPERRTARFVLEAGKVTGKWCVGSRGYVL